MTLSARNQLKGTVEEIQLGGPRRGARRGKSRRKRDYTEKRRGDGAQEG